MKEIAMQDPTAKFDASRADEYAVQSQIALAGYDACHELSGCLVCARGAVFQQLVLGGLGGGSWLVF